MSDTAELAVRRTPERITTRDEYTGALAFWREQQFNVLSPFTNISGLAEQHALIASVVRIDGDPQSVAGDVYGGTPFLKGQRGTPTEEVALAKLALRKIAECGGISITTARTDPRTIPHFWEFKAIASYRGIDGGLVVREATAEWDLREGSERLKGWTANQITEGRKNGLRNAEARAINAAIRECGTGLKQKYTRAELARPFVVLRVMFQPDMSDPETRRQVTARALAGTAQLYPVAALAEPTLLEAEPEGEPEAGGLLQSVTAEDRRRRDGSTLRRWQVVDAAGEPWVTVDPEIGVALERALAERRPVELRGEEDTAGDLVVLEVVGVGTARALPARGDL